MEQLALETERVLRSGVVRLDAECAEVGKALLVRDARRPLAPSALALLACDTDDQWSRYEAHRIPVEAAFGLDEPAARALVRRTRQRAALLGMRLWLATSPAHEDLVGGIAAFRYPESAGSAARLQEVDVFPAFRGQGHGAALLESARRLLVREGVGTLVIGADEDDWPIDWYRRLGFRDVMRVSKPAAAWVPFCDVPQAVRLSGRRGPRRGPPRKRPAGGRLPDAGDPRSVRPD